MRVWEETVGPEDLSDEDREMNRRAREMLEPRNFRL